MIGPWMRARAAEAWTADCRYLSRSFQKILVKDAHSVSKGKVDTCPQALDFFGESASGDGVNTFPGKVSSLRVEGDFAYSQYHGTDGKDWVVPVDRERGVWLVSIASPLDRNK